MRGDGGIVEIDETIYGREATHRKGRKPAHARKRTRITNSAQWMAGDC